MPTIRRLSVVVASVLVAPALSVLTGTAPAAASAHADEPPAPTSSFQVDEERSAPTDETDRAWLDPEVTLPAPGEVEVDVPESGWARAGSSPVSVGLPSAGLPPSRVRVRMLSQDEVKAAGGRLLGFEVTRADGGSAVGALAVSIDYSGIEKAFGGNLASRLKLVRSVDCPVEAACLRPRMTAANEVASSRMRAMSIPVRPDPSARQLSGETTGTAPEEDSGLGPQTAELDESAAMDSVLSGTTFMMMSSTSGSAGDFGATDLSASDRWAVGVGSGGFTYSYPIEVPPSINGPSPVLSLDYSSQSVDGRTVAENGQPSKVGEGWSFEPGFIERRFHSCGEETAGRTDLCWSANNEYFIHFMGMSGELVRTSGTSNEWRIQGNDPGWRVVSFTQCCANGDNDGEFFVVFAPDGTKYWMGYGVEPRSNFSTNSAYTVPVYGSSGEPCYNATPTLAWCQQAYRWNVDRILDRNGVVTSFFYTKEMNKYTRYGGAATDYVRSGYLSRVEYGQLDLQEAGPAYGQVRVNTSYRCASQVACPAPTPSSLQTSYPDVPLDLMCTTAPCDQTSPSFWSTVQIKSIETEFWNEEASPDAYTLVSIYRMAYSFPTTGDDSSPSLWLTDITKTGEYGVGSTDLPGVRMTGVNKNNRVNDNGVDGLLPKYRIASISTDLGARVNVTYGTPDPCPVAPAMPDSDVNPDDCFPARYLGAWIPFHKYLVTDLLIEDVRGGGLSKSVHYTYADDAAWHYTDSLLTPATEQSWADYRGYADVRVTVDGGGASAGTDTRYLLFRGMYGDKLDNGTSKTTQLPADSFGVVFNDFAWRRGQTLEVKNVDSTDGHFASTVYRYNADLTIDGPNGWETHDSHYVRPSQTFERVKNIDTGAWRDREIASTYSATTGQRAEWSDYQTASANDNTCTKLGVTTNIATGTTGGSTHWITAAPYRKIVYGDYCGSGSTNVIEQTQIDYDGHAYADPPTNQNITQVRAYQDSTAVATTKTTYDTYGRVTSVITPNEVASGANGMITTTYTPATGYPHSGVTTDPLAGATTKTVPYPAWGTTRRIEDVSNGDTTSFAVDHLGRTTSVTRPGDVSGTPSYTFDYRVTAGVPNYVRTNRLLSGTSYVSSWEYLDGLGRTLQTQEPEPNGGTGRRLTMTRYDNLGQVAAVSQPFGATGSPGSGLAVVALTDIPFETRHGYDSAGRVYRTAQWANNVLKSATNTNHHGWHQVVDAPVHSDVDYHTDALGQVTSVVERPVSGTITTAYTYTRHGDVATITDAAGNVTSYTYDDLRRRTASSDPDQGAWSTTYTAESQVLEVTDAKNEKVAHTYDRGGRRTEARAGVGGSLLAQWTYDTLTNGIGRLTSATSHSGGAAYTTAVTGYDNLGRVTGRSWTIPSTPSAALAGTYAYSYGYNASDDLVSVTSPAAGGLAAETVTTGLNTAGLPVSLTGTDTYVASTTYQLDGRLASRNLVGGVTRSYTYDTTAGRLSRLQTSAPVGGSTVPIEDTTYTYDGDNNVTAVVDAIAGVGTTAQRECFTYDPLNRLTAAYTTSATSCGAGHVAFGSDPYNATYAYDNLGDITSTTLNGVTSAYTYGVAGHAHAPASIGGAAYVHDANGATTTRPTPGGNQTLTWDRFHRLTTVTGPSASSFVYDADGNRLLRTTSTDTTLYLDGMELKATGSTVTGTRYYGSLAMRTAAGVSVLLHNRHNSTTAAYNTVADTVAYQRYTPYGSRRGAVPLAATERRFIDKIEDATGLIAMGARYYDPTNARFVSVDPLADLAQPQSLAGYAYALGNPATLYDPTGLVADDPDGAGSNDNECARAKNCSDKYDHELIVHTVINNIKAGRPTPDEVFQAGNFDAEEQKNLVSTMAASPCSIGTDRSACQGNSYGIFYCQMEGKTDCAREAAIVAASGGAMAAIMMAWLAQGLSKSLDSVGAVLGQPADLNKALSGLPRGRNPDFRVVRSEAELQQLYAELSRGASPIATPPKYRGTWVERPDGVRVGIRVGSKSGGSTIDIRLPNGQIVKVHIEP